MSKDLHDIDELFRSGLEDHEEIPSVSVKESLDVALDKKEAEKYKRRFILWKRTALLLLLLLAGFVIYESGLIKKDPDVYTSKIGNENKPGNSKEALIQDKNTAAGTTLNNAGTNQPVTENNIAIIPKSSFLIKSGGTSTKNKRTGKPVSLIVPQQGPLFSIIASHPDKKQKEPPEYMSTDSYTPVIEALDKRISIAVSSERLLNRITSLQPFIVKNFPAKSNNDSYTSEKKRNHSKPLWTISPFVSYDQAGYRLDSDEPSAISSIKFREANEPSFSAGLLLGRQLNSRFSLQSGIVYRNTAIGMKPQKTYAFVDPTGDVAYKYITSSGYAFIKPGFGPQPSVGDSLTTAEAKHTLENISVPLMAKYALVNKKVSIVPGAGVEANFITKANLEVDIEDPFNREIVVVRKLNGTNSFYWSFIAEAEIKYTLNKKVSINLRPVYRQAISPITKNNIVETFPRSFGMGAGVTIKF
jgi:Outer membrane protein beta-barrel domain